MVNIIEERSLILSQVYLALKHSLTMDKGNSCRNVYTKRLNDILRGGKPFLGKLEKLKMLLPPADNEPANSADNREGEGQGKTTFCLALNTDGRKARLTWEQGSLNLYALSDEYVDARIMVKVWHCCVDLCIYFTVAVSNILYMLFLLFCLKYVEYVYNRTS